jgi:hypothetical protein
LHPGYRSGDHRAGSPETAPFNMAQPQGNMPYNLAQAGAAVGRNRSTILKAIRRGAISATRDEATGGWLIEPAELHRVFPPVADGTSGNTRGNAATSGATPETGEVRELRARLEAAEAALGFRDETIRDLRQRLDAESEERRRLTAVLSDQRAAPPLQPVLRRSWWRWR